MEYKAEMDGDEIATPKAPTAQEVKATLDKIHETVAALRKENDALQAEVKAGKTGVAEQKAKVDKINEDLGKALEMKAQMDRVEAALRRMSEQATGGIEGKAGDTPAMREYKAALMKFVRRGSGDRETLSALQMKALTVQSEPDGGYSVTPDMSGRMIGFIRETSPLRGLANVQTIGVDALEGYFDDDESTTGANWEGEVETNGETATPKIGKWSIPVHYIRARPYASQQMLDDSAFNVEAWLTGKVSRMFGYKEAEAFVTGNGVMKPRGFMTYTHGATYSRTTIQQVDVSSTGAITSDGLINLAYSLKKVYRQRATWVANRLTYGKIRLLKDGDDQYLWQPGLQAGQPDRLLGMPTEELADIADVGSNALAVALADWQEAYQIVDREGFTVLRDPYSGKPRVEFYCRRRVGGGVLNTDAIKIGKIGTP